jgi:superfamily II DNA or RNA helicase
MTRASVRVGISATPFKFGETDKCQKLETKGFFGPVVKYQGRILTTKELQERGTLSPTNCVFYPIDEPQLPYETYMDAVTLGIAESIYFNKTVARLAKKLKGRTLIIVERVAQGEMLNQLIPGSHWVFGKDNADSRKEVIELLQKSKNCVCIVQQKLISAGINVFVHNLICCASSKADHLLIQRLGRGLRKANDKEVLNYYDFFFHINEYLTKHSVHRVKILREEGHEVTIKDEIDF